MEGIINLIFHRHIHKFIKILIITMLFKITTIFAIAFHLCHFGGLAAPAFPCCPGSQQVTTLMHGYIVAFTSSVDTDEKQTMCQSIIDGVKCLKQQLASMTKCVDGGGAKIVREIDDQLTQLAGDACANGLSFVRAMFDMAAKATGHTKSQKWENVSKNFVTQIGIVDEVSHRFNINITKNVQFDNPSNADSAHQTVPTPDQVFSNPGKHSAYTK